jgi:hypothetical protein
MGPQANLGGSEVIGTLVDRDSNAVRDAIVKVYPAGTRDTSIAPTDCDTSDDTGGFQLSSLPAGRYDLYGTAGNGALVLFYPGVDYDSSIKINKQDLDLGILIMLPPGAIEGQVTLSNGPGDLRGIECFIPGTSFAARTDSVGHFVMTMVPPGTYEVEIRNDGYLPFIISQLTVNSGDTSRIASVDLHVDPSGPPPAPTGLTAKFDTLTGVTILSWHPVRVSDLAGYHLYAIVNSELCSLVSSATIADTFVTDNSRNHAPRNDSQVPLDSFRIIYLVKAVDTGPNESGVFSNKDTVFVVPVSKITTAVDLRIANASNDTIALVDTAKIVASFANPTRLNTQVRWSVGSPDSVVRTTTLPVPVSVGCDTLRIVFTKPGSQLIYVRVFDNSGSVWTASRQVTSRGTVLPVNTWFPCSSMAEKRLYPGAAAVNGKVYVMGGYYKRYTSLTNTWKQVVLASVEEYDTSARHWTLRAPMPCAKYGFATAVVNGKIYVFGGMQSQLSRSVERYDPLLNQWDSIGQMPSTRVLHSAAVVNGKIYLFGGQVNDTLISNAIDEFNPATLQWRSAGIMSKPRLLHQVVAAGSHIYVLGGKGGSGSEEKCLMLNSVEDYNSSNGSCVLLSSISVMNAARCSFAAGEVNGRIHAIGGAFLDAPPSTLRSVEEFDPVKKQWESKSIMGVGRWGTAVASLDGRFYVIGGAYDCGTENPNATNAVEIYFP